MVTGGQIGRYCIPFNPMLQNKEMRRFLGEDETKYLDKWRASLTNSQTSSGKCSHNCKNVVLVAMLLTSFNLRLLVLFFPLIIRFKTGFTVLNAMLSLDNNVARFCFSCLSS